MGEIVTQKTKLELLSGCGNIVVSLKESVFVVTIVFFFENSQKVWFFAKLRVPDLLLCTKQS